MSTYVDTSFLVSLYITEIHTSEAERLMASSPAIWLTPLHIAEWIHAIEQHVFQGLISGSECDRYYQRFEDHRKAGIWNETAVPVDAFAPCAQLGRQYAARFGLRTLDTLHVASALALGARTFWTFDERQKELARAVGLKTG